MILCQCGGNVHSERQEKRTVLICNDCGKRVGVVTDANDSAARGPGMEKRPSKPLAADPLERR